jgi:hypothetical protein
VNKYFRKATPLAQRLQWAAVVLLVLAITALLVVLFTQQQSYRTQAQTMGGGASVAAGPSATATGSTPESPEAISEDPASRQAQTARDVVNGTGDAVISILGDSTSDTSTEWVYRWAEELGADATVTVHTWNPATADWFPQTRNYGSGDRTITLWNASAAGANPTFPLINDGMMQPDADLTILNYGHWGMPQTVEASLGELLGSLGAGGEGAAPVVLTAQNPARETWFGYSDTNRDAMRATAQERGLPVIDVHAAFEENGDWEGLLVDEANPSDEGHQLWAETVSAFFAG